MDECRGCTKGLTQTKKDRTQMNKGMCIEELFCLSQTPAIVLLQTILNKIIVIERIQGLIVVLGPNKRHNSGFE